MLMLFLAQLERDGSDTGWSLVVVQRLFNRFPYFLPELFLKLSVGSLASNHSPGASISRLIISASGKLITIVLNAVC
jgi:hypothetical protein